MKAVLVSFLFLTGLTLAEMSSPPPTCACGIPGKWEYKVVFIPGSWESLEIRLPRALEEAGEQGWELVGNYQERLIFKRRKAGQFFPDQHVAAPSAQKEKAQRESGQD